MEGVLVQTGNIEMGKTFNRMKGRTYIHQKCGKVTRVTGGDFAGLCNPYEPCTGTICAACGGPDSVGSFSWEDTGESVADYRKRLRGEAPLSYRLWAWVIGPLIGAGIGGAAGALFIRKNLAADAGIGAAIGAALMFLFIGPKILGLIAGDRFYTTR